MEAVGMDAAGMRGAYGAIGAMGAGPGAWISVGTEGLVCGAPALYIYMELETEMETIEDDKEVARK